MSLDLKQIQKQKRNSPIANDKGDEVIHFWKKDISFGKTMTDKVKETFYSELVILLTAGLDMKAALDIVVREENNSKVKPIFEDVTNKILHGATFSEAIEGKSEFGPYEFFSLKIGEESGRMIEVLQELSLFYQKKMKQRKQIVSAVSYPLLIFITAFGAVFFMMNFIVPLFADAFKRFNSDLPALTKGVIFLSGAFRTYWPIIPLTIVGIVAAYRSFRQKQWYRKNMSDALLKSPLIGKLMQKIYLASFCQSMALMTAAKTPLIQSLDLVSKMIGLYPLEKALDKIKDDLYRGKLLNESMAEFPIFESRMVSLIKVGEETNRLATIFKRLYEQYSEETDHQTAIISSMLEPLLIIVVGGMVALILVAMYLPMFKLGSSLMG